jgi:hypothetical protein
MQRALSDVAFTRSPSALQDWTARIELEFGSLDTSLQKVLFFVPQAIPSKEANSRCADIGLPKLSERLRLLHGGVDPSNSIMSMLEDFVVENQIDFGMAHALTRRIWRDEDPKGRELKDSSMRLQALDQEKRCLPDPGIPPRRLWDLYANRVVPYWVTKINYDEPSTSVNMAPVTHSWMPEHLRHPILTPVNSFEWPVPIPKEVTLQRIRLQLLNKGVEYAWLDALCLRQVCSDESKEHTRKEEWKLDVPIIGSIYQRARVTIPYFSGLGLPFRIGDFDSSFHYANRAWTLQEDTFSFQTIAQRYFGTERFEAAGHGNITVLSWADMSERNREFFRRLHKGIYLSGIGASDGHQVLMTMVPRSCATPLDRIAGLAYPLKCQPSPIYEENQTTEEAWTRLVLFLDNKQRGDIFVWFPQTGHSANGKWCPSWQQIMEASLPDSSGFDNLIPYTGEGPCTISRDLGSGVYQFLGWQRDNCLFHKDGTLTLAASNYDDHQQENMRQGNSQIRQQYTYKTSGGYPLEDDVLYTMLGAASFGTRWAVGQINASGQFEKITVIEIWDPSDGYIGSTFRQECHRSQIVLA